MKKATSDERIASLFVKENFTLMACPACRAFAYKYSYSIFFYLFSGPCVLPALLPHLACTLFFPALHGLFVYEALQLLCV